MRRTYSSAAVPVVALLFVLAFVACGGSDDDDGPAACTDDIDCATDEVCRPFTGGPSICQAAGQDGERCDEDADCASGLQCEAGFCDVSIAAGDPCSNATAPCPGGTFCVGPPGFTYCGELLTEGGVCNVDSECVPPLTCVGRRCSEPPPDGECTAETDCPIDSDCEMRDGPNVCITRVATGQPCGGLRVCTGDDECRATAPGESFVCLSPGLADAYCETNRHCAAPYECRTDAPQPSCFLPDVPELGDRCGEDEECAGVGVCRPDCDPANCPSSAQSCQRVGTAGESCRDGVDCEDPDGCVIEDGAFVGFCAGPAPVGSVCNRSSDCEDGLVCRPDGRDLRCQSPAQVGEACNTSDDCDDELFCRGDALFGDRSCRLALGDVGDRCSLPAECDSGLDCEPDMDGVARCTEGT